MSRVYACFWFDVEDYVTPQSDDALLRLAEAFSARGLSATFKFVGEKARRLRARGRGDVIGAVARHDVGYHTDLHSVHPTVSEYLEGMTWEDGIAEFGRRERQGLEDVEEVFGKGCSTYGQPGGSWAPHVYPALRRWGVRTYVDEAQHVGLNDQPFWYCGVLNVLRLRSRFTRLRLDGSGSAAEACGAFDRIAGQLEADGGGIISICHHECEWATHGFWDGVNFARGANPALDELRAPPLKDAGDVARDFEALGEYLDHVRASGVQVVTAAELPRLFPDHWTAEPLSPDVVFGLADCLADGVRYQPVPYGWASAAEATAVVVRALCHRLETGGMPRAVEGRYVEGPPERPRATGSCVVAREVFLEACRGLRRHLDGTGRMPADIALGEHVVSPAAFAQAVARVLLLDISATSTGLVVVEETPLECEAEVIEEGAFDWVIFPEGFRAPRLMDLARLQTWTLKPAML